MIAPDGIKRLILWQPATKQRVDMGGHHLKNASFLPEEVSFFDGGDGSQYATEKRRPFSIEISDMAAIEGLRDLEVNEEPVRMIAFSFKKHVQWYEASNMVLTPTRPGARQVAGERLQVTSSTFFAEVHQEENFLRTMPWHEANLQTSGQVTYLYHPYNQGANHWEVQWDGTTTGTVTFNIGNEITISQAAVLVGEVLLPAQLAVIEIHIPDEVLGATIEMVDSAGTVVDTLTMNAGEVREHEIKWAHWVRFKVDVDNSTFSVPKLLIKDAGAPQMAIGQMGGYENVV